MPELTSYYKLKMKVRQYPPLHRPLKSIRRFWEVAVERKILEIWRVVSPAANPRFGPPKSSFSVYTAPRYEGRSPSRIVLHDQGKLDAAPESLLAKSRLSQHEFQPWPVFWSKHPNARLVSTSLALLEKEKQLCRESVYHDRAMVDDAAWNYVKLPKETLIPGNWTSIVSRWCPDDRVAPFSHWILDALPRLALLAEFPADTGI
jgi:hypothetical protein